MAGIVPLSGRSGRKQWALHDGPKGSLRRLRSQLAEDGCPESQVVLAKQLLEERCDLEVDREENEKLGVYWLTKASEQGNLEATDILRKCLVTGRGITEHNYYDVKSCLDMSQDEKLARRAAREMFTSLSNGEDFITTEQLHRRMRDLSSPRSSLYRNSARGCSSSACYSSQRTLIDSVDDSSCPEDNIANGDGNSYGGASPGKSEGRASVSQPDWASGEYQGEKISEAALVSAAASYARGILPIVSQAISTVDPHQLTLDTIPLLQRPFLYPLASLKRHYAWLIETLGNRGGTSLRKLLFTCTNVHLVLLVLVYSLMGTESILLFIPMLLYYLSFVVMVIATCQMLQRKRELSDFRVWSRLFLSYSNGNLNPEEAEYQFCRNNLRPYGHFFLALFVNLMIYPLIAHQWTPQSEFTIVAVTLTLITLVNFTWRDGRADFLTLFSFAVHVLAKYPYETDMVVAQGWRFLDVRVPTFASYVVGNGIEFCLNFRAVFYLLIPGVFAKIAARDGWRGTYKTLIPHCVTLSWWQIAILSSQGATWYGLIRGALALVGMVVFLPIAGIASIILPIVAATRYLSESDLPMRVTVTALLGGTPFLASWYLRKSRAPRFNWIVTCMQLLLGFAAGVFLCWPMIVDYKTHDPTPYEIVAPPLSWEQYQNYCHQPAWEESSSKAQIQVRCSGLEGVAVSWDGYVTNVKLKSVRNTLTKILHPLPDGGLKSTLRCLFGEAYEERECDKRSSEMQKRNCKAFLQVQKQKHRCDLSAWNRYEFEINVKMKSSLWGSNAQIRLIADHSFANFSLNVYPGDKIWFSGILTIADSEGDSLLGGSNPRVAVEEIGCLACHVIDLKSYKRYRYRVNVGSLIRDVWLGAKAVLNFLLNPIVIFK